MVQLTKAKVDRDYFSDKKSLNRPRSYGVIDRVVACGARRPGLDSTNI